MRASELRKVYLATVRLYGFIFVEELFALFDHYQLDYKKAQVYRDLDSRVGKNTRGYQVLKGQERQFVIADPDMSDELLQAVGTAKQGKPFYYPPTFPKFLLYADPLYSDPNDEDAFINISRFLKSRLDEDEGLIEDFTDLFIDLTKYGSPGEALSFFNELGFAFKKDKDLERFLELVTKYGNNLRTPHNNGFTAFEIAKIMGPVRFDKNNIKMTLGPNIKKRILSGETDHYEMLKDIEDSDLPSKMKASLREHLLEIIKEANKLS